MENESRFYVGFYCVFRSTQRTVVIESFYQAYVIIKKLIYYSGTLVQFTIENRS